MHVINSFYTKKITHIENVATKFSPSEHIYLLDFVIIRQITENTVLRNQV
jgi:hypothetical protein